jgi:hypothetical protein
MRKVMNCQQFQEVLPYIIESGGNQEALEHLDTCPSCAELVRDLQYIAQQAKLLLPMHDPSPRVWEGIEQSLNRQGMLQEDRMSLWGHTTTISTQSKSWTPLGWMMALAASAAFAVLLINYRPQLPPIQSSSQNMSAQPALNDDQILVSQIAQRAPEERRAYEDSLREVNAYITDAQAAVDQDPEDVAARARLLDARQQKEVLYEMATVRGLP